MPIMIGRPVLMRGYVYYNNIGGYIVAQGGHAWVCEGYHPSARYIASVSFPFHGPRFYKESEFFIEYDNTVSYSSSHYFYMNFGATNGINGWYTYCCQDPSTGNYLYHYNQNTLFISKP